MFQAAYKPIIVSSVKKVLEHVHRTDKPLAVLSLDYPENKDDNVPSPILDIPGVDQKIMVFWDVLDDRPHAPSRADVEQCLDFVNQHARTHNVIVQCQAGLSRSASIAFGELARRMGPKKAATELTTLVPRAKLNLRIVRFSEEILGFKRGVLIDAICANRILKTNIRCRDKKAPLDFGLTPEQAEMLDQPQNPPQAALRRAVKQRNSR